ncbi:MAG: TRAP transporter large permease subunit, partial [Deltaproteobacteria bacterium]|nr:TRAP transporter large permease subunit [Deltaproteobacteria bacterium]
MARGGLTKRLIHFADIVIGGIRGGLSLANVVASMLFGGITGAAIADASALGAVEIPMMNDASALGAVEIPMMNDSLLYHFGIIVVMNLVIGLISPPLGLVLFVVEPIAKVSFEQVTKEVIPFLLVEIGVLLMVTYIPFISLWIPR